MHNRIDDLRKRDQTVVDYHSEPMKNDPLSQVIDLAMGNPHKYGDSQKCGLAFHQLYEISSFARLI